MYTANKSNCYMKLPFDHLMTTFSTYLSRKVSSTNSRQLYSTSYGSLSNLNHNQSILYTNIITTNLHLCWLTHNQYSLSTSTIKHTLYNFNHITSTFLVVAVKETTSLVINKRNEHARRSKANVLFGMFLRRIS